MGALIEGMESMRRRLAKFEFAPRLRNRLLRRLLPPIAARHAEYSMILSVDDDPSQPSPRLFDVSQRAIARAREIHLTDLASRNRVATRTIDVWPGDHHRLLAALVENERPQVVIEIGTFEGVSAMAMAKFLPVGGRLVTFDIAPWKSFPDTCFLESDFAGGRIEQRVDDLGDRNAFARHASLIEQADLLFIDAAKDGSLEQRIIAHLETVKFRRPPLVVFDDVRVWNMLQIWRDVRHPKLDLTSFGHFSGTGLVDWT